MALIEQFNRSGDGTMVVPSEYLEVVITRRPERGKQTEVSNDTTISVRLIRNSGTMEHVMIQTGLGSILSIKTLIWRDVLRHQLATITPVDRVTACGAQQKPDHSACRTQSKFERRLPRIARQVRSHGSRL